MTEPKKEKQTAASVLAEIKQIYHFSDDEFQSIEDTLFYLIYVLIGDKHSYCFDEKTNQFSGKRLDLTMIKDLCANYLEKRKIKLPVFQNPFLPEIKQTPAPAKFKQPLTYKSITKKRGEDNGAKNLEIKKENFWTAYKAWKNGNVNGYLDAQMFAHQIIADKFYTPSKYDALFQDFAKLYKKRRA